MRPVWPTEYRLRDIMRALTTIGEPGSELKNAQKRPRRHTRTIRRENIQRNRSYHFRWRSGGAKMVCWKMYFFHTRCYRWYPPQAFWERHLHKTKPYRKATWCIIKEKSYIDRVSASCKRIFTGFLQKISSETNAQLGEQRRWWRMLLR